MGIVVYNGVSSRDFNILVEHPPGYEYPDKDYEKTHVPGRNGDVIHYSGSYKNKDREYEIAIPAIFKPWDVAANEIVEWLQSADDYARLEDTYEPEYYRMAIYSEDNKIENILFGAGRGKIKFDCKPQRFLKAGEEVKTFLANGYLRNPTGFIATPKIILTTIDGNGVLNINHQIVKIKATLTGLVIDSYMQDCYSSADIPQNWNNNVEMNDFPVLHKGVNEITFNSSITKVEIIPNWWTI